MLPLDKKVDNAPEETELPQLHIHPSIYSLIHSTYQACSTSVGPVAVGIDHECEEAVGHGSEDENGEWTVRELTEAPGQ